MSRVLALIALWMLICVSSAAAQDPQVTVTSEQEEVIVGQPFILRVEILVPTFMPSAPVFPSFEVPGLIVRLPERATGPISKSIEGDTWSGVRRTYRIYPMQAGVTQIPEQSLSIIYKDTQTNDDVPLSLPVPAFEVNAVVPPGAQTLDPLVVARGVEITQTWQVPEGEMAVGDAVVRRLEVSVSGASALFVPPLLETPDGAEQAQFQPYPEDAQVTESFDQGVMSGTRTEQVSYIAQGDGPASFPELRLSWYNLDSEKIEEIVLPGQDVTVAMPPQVRGSLDRRQIALILGAVVLLGAVVWGARRWLWPRVTPIVDQVRDWYQGTAHAAHRAASAAATAQNLGGLLTALETQRLRGVPTHPDVDCAIHALTRARFRDAAGTAEQTKAWQGVQGALRRHGPRLVSQKSRTPDLPPLNPFSEK
ncbi:MAG: hypothetical protein AB8B58_13975 [Roseobacter sp.]